MKSQVRAGSDSIRLQKAYFKPTGDACEGMFDARLRLQRGLREWYAHCCTRGKSYLYNAGVPCVVVSVFLETSS